MQPVQTGTWGSAFFRRFRFFETVPNAE